MPKPELEFFKPDRIAWEPVAASATGGAGGAGVSQKILSKSEDGDVTRLLQFGAGVETTETITHDFWEEVWILEGELIDLGNDLEGGAADAAEPVDRDPWHLMPPSAVVNMSDEYRGSSRSLNQS